MKRFKLISGLLVVASLLSCQESISFSDTEEGVVSIGIDIRSKGPESTRSIVSPTEDRISNYSVFIYTRGRLVHDIYVDSREATTALLYKGQTYSVYALANTGDLTPPDAESELDEFMCIVSSISDLGEILPMAQKYGEVTVDDDTKFDFVVERLVSKIFFSLDALPVTGLKVKDVRLRQAPQCVYPFASGGSIADASQVVDGDYASTDDIYALNNGGNIVFYVLENMQGTLLPENTDPWSKVPENFTQSDACTYIEAECVFSQEVDGREGNVFYRMYLGTDNITNFDIPRNTQMSVSMAVSEGNLDKASWKLDAEYVQHATSLTLDKDALTILIGENGQLTASVLPVDADDRSVLWESSDPKIATVDENGLITPLKVGNCVITARSNDIREIYDECSLTVNKITYGYRLVLTGADHVYVGQETNPYQLSYYTDTYLNDVLIEQGELLVACPAAVVNWKIFSGTKYASVDGNGQVFGLDAGTSTLRATINLSGKDYQKDKEISIYSPTDVDFDTNWLKGDEVNY